MKKTGWIAVLAAAALLCAACGQVPAQTGAAVSEQESQTVRFLTIPEGSAVIDGSDPDKFTAKMEQALRDRAAHVCVRDGAPLDWEDFYAMDLGSFWLESFARSDLLTGRLEGESGDAIYQIYDLSYCDLTDEQIAQMRAQVEEKVREIASRVPAGADLWTKAKTVHDELIRRVRYDETLEAPHCHDPYGALVNGVAVCSGYASAFTAVMEALGESCPMVVSETHAWNRVGARTYQDFIDVTWDDMDTLDSDGMNYIHYTYFGLTREEVEAVDAHAIRGGANSITDYIKDPEIFNYCEHEGCLLTSCDEEAASRALAAQLRDGNNVLMLRFAKDADFQVALNWWEGEGEAASRVLLGSGFRGDYMYWTVDGLRTLLIALNPEG